MVAINPAVLNALTLDWSRKRADIDDQENRYRINYNSALDRMQRGYKDTTQRSAEGFSDRGMLHSGPSMQAGTKLRDDFNRNQAQGAQALNTNLATLARRRLEAKQELDSQKMLASLGLQSGR